MKFERARLFAGSAASLGRETNALNCAHDFRGQSWPPSRRRLPGGAAQFAYKPIAVFRPAIFGSSLFSMADEHLFNANGVVSSSPGLPA